MYPEVIPACPGLSDRGHLTLVSKEHLHVSWLTWNHKAMRQGYTECRDERLSVHLPKVKTMWFRVPTANATPWCTAAVHGWCCDLGGTWWEGPEIACPGAMGTGPGKQEWPYFSIVQNTWQREHRGLCNWARSTYFWQQKKGNFS